MFPEDFLTRPPSRSNRRLVTLVMAAMCLLLVVLTAAHEWQARAQALRQAEQSSRGLAASVLNAVDGALLQADTLVSLLVRSIDEKHELPGNASTTALHDVIRERVTGLSVLDDIYVYDAQGRLRLSSYAQLRYETSALQREFFQFHRRSARDDLHIGAPFRVEPHGDWVIPVSRRVDDAQGGFLGVVVTTISLKRWQADFEVLGLGPRGLVAVNSLDGLLLARHPHLDRAIGISLKDTPMFRDFLAPGRNGSAVLTSPVDGIARQTSFVHSGNFPVLVIVGSPLDEALAGWRSQAIRNAAVIGLLVLLIGGAGGLIHRLLGNQQRLMGEQERLIGHLRSAQRRSTDLERALDEHAVVAITSVKGEILHANDKFCALSKYSRRELVGQNHRVVRSDQHPASLYKDLWRRIARGDVWKGELCNRAKDGSTYWVDTTIVPFLGENGKPMRYIAIRTDITERKRAEREMHEAYGQLNRANQQLARLAAFDALTGLANRRQLDEAMAAELKRAQRAGQPLALLLMDVDHFKQFNDSYGHGTGDVCLKRVAQAVQTLQRRPGDLAARWGGEEFVLLLPDTDAEGARAVAELLRCAVLALHIPHRASPLRQVTASIGVHALEPARGGSLQALLDCADQALYQAKQLGRNRVQVFCATAVPPPNPPASDTTVPLALTET